MSTQANGHEQRPDDVAAIPDWNRMLDGKVAVVTGGGDLSLIHI